MFSMSNQVPAELQTAEDARYEYVNRVRDKPRGWIAFDLDGTTAHYDKWRGHLHIGAPIAPMVERIKAVVEADEYDAKIFTARVAVRNVTERWEARKAIEDWCVAVFGFALPVTCEKDFGMATLFDDRCFRVENNTGLVAMYSDDYMRAIVGDVYSFFDNYFDDDTSSHVELPPLTHSMRAAILERIKKRLQEE